MYEMNPITLAFSGEVERSFQEQYFQKVIKQMRIALILGGTLYALFGILDRSLVAEAFTKIWLIRYVIVCPLVVVAIFLTYSSYFKRFVQGIVSFVMLISGLGIVAMTNIASPPGSYYYYAGLILILMFFYNVIRLRFIYATTLSLIILSAYEITAIWVTKTPYTILLSNNFFLISANIFGMFACYLMELYIRKEFIQRQLLEAEEEKSERLLLNILPKGIAERLKQTQGDMSVTPSKIIVDKFSDVTILFADIVEFTAFSSRISPEALVVFLNELFSIFDNIAEKHGLEKIKTIGDSYMVVGGLPDPHPNHAEAIAEMALDMQEEVAKFKVAKEGQLRIRIGIHTGSVVAGVIGRKKFSYDLWGNTVNVASRMEHHSIAGSILASEESYRRLRSKYKFVERERIEVKGKGSLNTYFLVGRNHQL